MRQLTLALWSILFSMLLWGCDSPTGNPEDGKRWFAKNNCSSCHGIDGKKGKAPQLAGLKMKYSSFVKKLRKPNSTIMPDYPKKEVSDQDVADIYSWLKILDGN